MSENVEQLGGRRERRKLETRARIEDAAYQLFHSQGVEETTIEQVCDEADVARRTFYGYYSNKRELLAHMGIKRIYSRTEPMMEELMSGFQTTVERIEGMIEYAKNNFLQFDDVDREIILLAPSVLTPDNEMHEKIENSAMSSFVELLEVGKRNGEVSETVSTQMIATVIMGTLNVLTSQWATDKSFPIAKRLDEAKLLFTRIIAL